MNSNLELELIALTELKLQYEYAVSNKCFSQALEIKERLDIIKEQCIIDMMQCISSQNIDIKRKAA